MQKKMKIILFTTVILVIVILFVPFSGNIYEDGGTRIYCSLTYKIVKWNRMDSAHGENGAIERIDIYNESSVYWLPHNFKSIDELWEMEKEGN